MPYYFKDTNKWGVSDEVGLVVRAQEPNWEERMEYYEPTDPVFEPHFQVATEVQPEMVDGKLTQKWRINQVDFESVIPHLTNRVQERLDQWASSKGYTNIVTLCTYATSKIEKFALEGQCGVDMRDATWSAFYNYLDAIKAKKAYQPDSWVEVQAKLPELLWYDQQPKVKDQENV